MTTTSLKISDELKSRVAEAAHAKGVSPHAFMVDAIQQVTNQAEKRERFVADALEARKEALESGEGFAADEVHAYLKSRLKKGSASAPEAKRWRD